MYALYELTRADGNKLYSGESSEQYTFNNKNVKIENLSPETLYILKEIDADKSYKKENIKFIIMSVIVVCIVIAGILVPGIVLEAKQKSEYDKVAQVPKDYLPSSSVMAKEASANLKLSEKLSLIDGQWDSTTDEAASYEMDDQDYQAVATARESMEKLYEQKLYPENLSPDYSNWYTWETTAYKASDNTFNTYTAYYWIIRFEKYDGTQTHTIWMLEDGTIILAREQTKDAIDVSIFESADGQGDALDSISLDDKITDDYTAAFSYSGIDFSKMNLIGQTTATEEKNQESYDVLQFLGDKQYVYVIREK